MPKFKGLYRVLEVKNNDLIIWKRERKITVNVDQVRIYHPRNSETSSYDSINETIYDGKGSNNWSNRLNSEKSRRSRKPSGNENKSCKSDKGNVGMEDLRVKRCKAAELTGTSERHKRKRPKICSPLKEESSREARVESGRARETRTKDSGGHSAAEERVVWSRKKTTGRHLARII
ncbi:uncharacterized protein TNCV_1743321 [Trichonephila clavipes]|nr:uncharacterized protein TNCV_1743321 [Trichonephila clavipes]